MPYRHNPKLSGSGIMAAIPQAGICPGGCKDCFFQSGRSYLEPLAENLPNMPSAEDAEGRVVRVNDGNDSNHQRILVIATTAPYKQRFFNTAGMDDLAGFPGPVVLTLNPGPMTDLDFHRLPDPMPKNLMFVRFRTNIWNTGEGSVCDQAVKYYTSRKVPVVLTMMAYYELTVPDVYREWYDFRTRTLNAYWVLTQAGWDVIMRRYADNPYVYACGKDAKTHACARCGNCLREYFATMERMRA
jgi:hypothetical protein